jgi:hypothetical protein
MFIEDERIEVETDVIAWEHSVSGTGVLRE